MSEIAESDKFVSALFGGIPPNEAWMYLFFIGLALAALAFNVHMLVTTHWSRARSREWSNDEFSTKVVDVLSVPGLNWKDPATITDADREKSKVWFTDLMKNTGRHTKRQIRIMLVADLIIGIPVNLAVLWGAIAVCMYAMTPLPALPVVCIGMYIRGAFIRAFTGDAYGEGQYLPHWLLKTAWFGVLTWPMTLLNLILLQLNIWCPYIGRDMLNAEKLYRMGMPCDKEFRPGDYKYRLPDGSILVEEYS